MFKDIQRNNALAQRSPTAIWLIVVCLAMATSFNAARSAPREEIDEQTLRAEGDVRRAPSSPKLESATATIVKRVNVARAKNDLSPLRQNEELTAAAEYFAKFMAKTDKYGHGADGAAPAARAREHGYDYCIVAENIAYQYSSAGFQSDELAKKFVRGWLESPEHRENMLDADVTETGVAIAQSDKTGYYYGVQLFGRPKSMAIEFSIRNAAGDEVVYSIADRTYSLPPRFTRTHLQCRPPTVKLLGVAERGDSKGSEKEQSQPDRNDQDSRQMAVATAKPAGGEKLVVEQTGDGLKLRPSDEAAGDR